jgi:uncharacterized protein YecE (DUF72 family)
MMPGQLRIGCAGWTIPKQAATSFPRSGSHLDRYAQRFAAVEINSSFHRPHRRTTYERWAGAVPGGFAFSVKAPKEITHTFRLVGADAAPDAFLGQATGLGSKLTKSQFTARNDSACLVGFQPADGRVHRAMLESGA